MQMPRRAKPDIYIRKTNPEQADPRPHHVSRVQAAHTVIGFRASRRLGL